jgi:hypothetical protein
LAGNALMACEKGMLPADNKDRAIKLNTKIVRPARRFVSAMSQSGQTELKGTVLY